MSSMLKCPNPSCPYVFDPSQVPTGVVLSCPRCGMQFTLGAPVAAPPPPAYAGESAPTATLPGAGAQPAQQSGKQAAAGASAVQKRERPSAARHHAPPKGSKAQVVLLAIIASALIAGTALTIYFKFTGTKDGGSGGTVVRPDGIDLMFEEHAGWSEDPQTRATVQSVFHTAYRRENPEAYMIFGSRQSTDGRAPRLTEMSKDLRAAYPKLFDLTTVREEQSESPKWLGIAPGPNHSFRFRAQSAPDGIAWAGEGYAVAHKGIAYYWVSWCKENDFDALKAEFAEFRGKFAFIGRRNWEEKTSNVIAFKGDQVPYALSDAEGVWKELSVADLTAEKEADKQPLDKVLRAKVFPNRDRKAVASEAVLRVYVLDGAGEPLDRAKELAQALESALLKESDLVPAFADLTDPPQGDPTPDAPGLHKSTPVARVLSTVKESKSSNKLLVASGAKVGEKIVVVVCTCKAGERVLFETKFVQIAASLR